MHIIEQEPEIIYKAILHTIEMQMLSILENIIEEATKHYLDVLIKVDVCMI